MTKVIVFSPSQEAIDNSLGARKYVTRLARHLEVEHRDYGAASEGVSPEGLHSVAVMAGLSGLLLQSGYVETELDTVFEPQEILRHLRETMPRDFPIVAVVDDAYSDYLMATYLRAGASAVVGTAGQLFGIVLSRISGWDEIGPYINQYRYV